MSTPFVTVRLPRFLTHFRSEMEELPERIIEKTAPVLKSAEQESIRERWFDTGATLKSLRERFRRKGSDREYRLYPTTRYAIFGEIGTRTLRPRYYSRAAIQNARPQVVQKAQQEVRRFARNVTVK